MTAIRKFEPSQSLGDTFRSLRSSPVFAFYVLVTLGVAGYIGLMVGQMALGLDFFLPGLFGQMSHGATESHRTHDVTYGLLIMTTVVGVVAQLRRPTNNVAGMVMALIAFAGLVLAAVLSDEFEVVVQGTPFRLVAAVTATAALLHPAGRSFFRSFRLSRINWIMVSLVGIAAVPLLSFASTSIRLQGSIRDEHFAMGHYAFMAAWTFTVVGVGLLASLRPDGWRLPAWVAGILSALIGISSLLYPGAASSLDLGWAVATIAWGGVFVAAAELTKNAEGTTRGPSLGRGAQGDRNGQRNTRTTEPATRHDLPTRAGRLQRRVVGAPCHAATSTEAAGSLARSHRLLALSAVLAAGMLVAGCGDDEPTTGASSTIERPNTVMASGTDRLAFDPREFSIPAGREVALELKAASVDHDFVVEGAAKYGAAKTDHKAVNPEDLHVAHADSGKTVTATFMIDRAGTYTVYCSVAGHRAAGMVASLTVN